MATVMAAHPPRAGRRGRRAGAGHVASVTRHVSGWVRFLAAAAAQAAGPGPADWSEEPTELPECLPGRPRLARARGGSWRPSSRPGGLLACLGCGLRHLRPQRVSGQGPRCQHPPPGLGSQPQGDSHRQQLSVGWGTSWGGVSGDSKTNVCLLILLPVIAKACGWRHAHLGRGKPEDLRLWLASHISLL